MQELKQVLYDETGEMIPIDYGQQGTSSLTRFFKKFINR